MQQREVTRSLGHLSHNFLCPENLPALVPKCTICTEHVPPLRCPTVWCSAWKSLDRDGPLRLHAHVTAHVRWPVSWGSAGCQGPLCKYQAAEDIASLQSPSRLRGDSGHSISICNKSSSTTSSGGWDSLDGWMAFTPTRTSHRAPSSLSHAQNWWLSELLNKKVRVWFSTAAYATLRIQIGPPRTSFLIAGSVRSNNLPFGGNIQACQRPWGTLKCGSEYS